MKNSIKQNGFIERQVLTYLTTSERLTLLEQIFAPQGGDKLEYATCSLSDMEFLFDFEDANMVELTWHGGECELSEIIDRVKHLISPEVEQKFGLGMPYFIHAILLCEPITVQKMIGWLDHDETIALEHFVSTKLKSRYNTLRIVFIKNEIGNKIADEAFKNNRVINN